MTKIKPEKEYEIAIQQLQNESQVIWSYSEAYVLANTIIFGFIAQNFEKQINPTFFLALMGLFVTIIWWGSAERRWAWYEFRMSQAKEKGNVIGSDLLIGKAVSFSAGEYVDLDPHQLNWLARIFKTNTSIRSLIGIFILSYVFVMLIKNPFFSIYWK